MLPVILGIVALVLAFLFPILGIIVAVVDLIISIIGATKKDKNAIIGLVLSIIALVFGLFITLTAIKATSSTIDNSRKDSFASTAQNYINAVRNSTLAGEIVCSPNASEEASNQFAEAKNNGDYYFFISSGGNAITSQVSNFDSSIANKAEEQTSELLGYVNKSSWGNKDVYGYIHFNIENNVKTYYIALADVDGHGFATELQDQNVKRVNVETKNVKVDMNKALNSINNDATYYCHLQ